LTLGNTVVVATQLYAQGFEFTLRNRLIFRGATINPKIPLSYFHPFPLKPKKIQLVRYILLRCYRFFFDLKILERGDLIMLPTKHLHKGMWTAFLKVFLLPIFFICSGWFPPNTHADPSQKSGIKFYQSLPQIKREEITIIDNYSVEVSLGSDQKGVSSNIIDVLRSIPIVSKTKMPAEARFRGIQTLRRMP